MQIVLGFVLQIIYAARGMCSPFGNRDIRFAFHELGAWRLQVFDRSYLGPIRNTKQQRLVMHGARWRTEPKRSVSTAVLVYVR